MELDHIHDLCACGGDHCITKTIVLARSNRSIGSRDVVITTFMLVCDAFPTSYCTTVTPSKINELTPRMLSYVKRYDTEMEAMALHVRLARMSSFDFQIEVGNNNVYRI